MVLQEGVNVRKLSVRVNLAFYREPRTVESVIFRLTWLLLRLTWAAFECYVCLPPFPHSLILSFWNSKNRNTFSWLLFSQCKSYTLFVLLPWYLFGPIVSCRREALALQEKCAQECTAAYRWVKIVHVTRRKIQKHLLV